MHDACGSAGCWIKAICLAVVSSDAAGWCHVLTPDSFQTHTILSLSVVSLSALS
uniref:Uncharacterized protein n=1 Tax=Anguilla anguilla TaxID=7936 RepID=A0A0E9UBG9_ANGAN